VIDEKSTGSYDHLMKIYLGLLESAPPRQTRVFGESDGQLIDLALLYAACLSAAGDHASAYERAAFYFPETIAEFFARGRQSFQALEEAVSFAQRVGLRDVCGPAGEKVVYDPTQVRILPPFESPEKSFVIGFSDRARVEALPKAEIVTGFYKLPQTFITSGAPIIWPKFSEEIDADACLALVIGKAGKRIEPAEAWGHVGGVTLLIDITARDINRREGLTTNNLLGKNFPSSTSLGPAVLTGLQQKELEALEVELAIDGNVKQQFTLRDCVFNVEQIIARWSILGIKPGDFFAIGATMALKGDRLQSSVPLKVGSTVRCSSSAIGELSHQVHSREGVRR
jgi:2-keto-4-pentenoate hydratase/2-oxohepta-3-ene-1,7-dioic acid hydratase in catechol pathway